MTMKTVRYLSSLIIAGLMLCFCFKASAGPGPGDLLTQAYATLEKADHDYKGHRVAAMHQIAAAGKALGIKVHGDGKGHEPQGESDAQLRTAQGLLQQAQAGLTGKALKHAQHAIKQISVALSIK
jgi:hypothetical protein